MKLIKRLFWFCVVVFVASVVGMFWYLTPERVRAFVEPRLEKGFDGREVEMERVDWGVGEGVVVEGLVVKDRMGKGIFVEAKRAQVDVSPGTLLWGEGRLGELVLEGVVVSVVVDEKGEVEAGNVLGKGGLQLPVDRVRVVDGTVRVDNKRRGRLTVVSGIDGRMLGQKAGDAVLLDNDLKVREVMTVAKGDTSRLEGLGLLGRMKVGEGVWEADDVQVQIEPWAMQLSGVVRDPLRSFVVDLKGRRQKINLEGVKQYLVSGGVLNVGSTVTGEGYSEVVIKGGWPFDVKGKVELEGVALTDRTQFALPIVEGALGLFLEGDRVRVHAAKARMGRSDFSMSGVIDRVWSERPRVSFAFVSKLFDLDEMRPQSDALAWGWTGDAFADEGDGALEALVGRVDVDGSIRVGEGVWHGAVFSNVETAMRGRKGRLHVGPVFGQVCEGALKGNVVLDDGLLDGSLALVNARAELVVKALGWEVPIYGAINVTSKLSGSLDALGQANGLVRMAEGRLVNWGFLQRELQGVEQLGLLTAEEVPLKDVTVVFHVEGDEVRLDGTKLEAAEMACVVGGKGVLGGDLHYVLDVDVPASRIKVAGFNVGQALGALLGRQAMIPVRAKIGGTVSVPEVVVEIR